MIPVSSQQAFRDALVQFDKELRQSGEWLGWEITGPTGLQSTDGGKLYPAEANRFDGHWRAGERV